MKSQYINPSKKLKSSVSHSEIKLESLNEKWIFHILGHHRDLVQRQVRHIFQDEDPAATRGGVGFDDPKSTLLVVHLQKLLKGEKRVKSLKSGKSTQVCIYTLSVICVHLCSSVFIFILVSDFMISIYTEQLAIINLHPSGKNHQTSSNKCFPSTLSVSVLNLLWQHEGLGHKIEGFRPKGLSHVTEVHPQTILPGELR